MADQKSSEEYGAEGGKKRAERLSKAELSDIGRKGALARWGKDLPTAVCDGILRVGELELPCAVLDDEQETRILSETEFMKALGIYRSGALSVRRKDGPGGARTPLSLAFKNLKPFVEKHLSDVHTQPRPFKTTAGQIAPGGIPASVIPKICEVWIDADRAGVLGPRQKQIAAKADKLHRALAVEGIERLVDIATGYQARQDQQRIAGYIAQYVAKDMRQWVRTFPRTFFEQLCRLRNIPFPDDMRLPQYIGHDINNLVWSRLAPGIKDELRRRNPAVDGRRKHKHHQFLTENVGNPRLLHHLGVLEGLASGFERGEWEQFKKKAERVLPNHVSLPLFASAEEDRPKRLKP